MLSPGLISPSSCITAAKFRRFTRNYHPQPSAPGLSEQVNDLSPGLCPRVTAITAALPAAKGLSPHTEERFSSSPLPQKPTRDPHAPTPRGLCPRSRAAPRRALPPSPPRRSAQPSVGYWENTEHSVSTPPEAPGLGRRPEEWLGTGGADVAGCPTSPGSRGSRLLPRSQSDSRAQSPRRARMPPGPPAAAAEPIGDGGFRRVFQTSA